MAHTNLLPERAANEDRDTTTAGPTVRQHGGLSVPNLTWSPISSWRHDDVSLTR